MEIEVTDETFEKEVVEKSKELPVLADFWAEWCGPCRILGPTLEKISEEFEGRLIVAKALTDDNQSQAQKYSVMSIPSVKLFKDGKIIDEFIGAKSEKEIRDFLNKNL